MSVKKISGRAQPSPLRPSRRDEEKAAAQVGLAAANSRAGPTLACMCQSDEPPKLSRSEEARRIIEEYADHLREIIKKLRRGLH